MPASSGLVNFFSADSASRLIEACQTQTIPSTSDKIISFSQRISPIDFLSVLAEKQSDTQLHFYWENAHKQEAILGYGSTNLLRLNAGNRFHDTQAYIKKLSKRIITIKDVETNHFSPRFFCNFTFFDSPKNSFCFPAATVLLPHFQIIKKNTDYFLIANCHIEKINKLELFINQTIEEAESIQAIGTKKINKEINHLSHKIPCHLHSQSTSRFKDSVVSALDYIEKDCFSKIVLADILDASSSTPFQLETSLRNLRQQYPNCYVFSISNGQGNYFIGASPERLISLRNQQLVTDALAGSIQRGKTIAQDIKLTAQLLVSEKERREHQAVIDFILRRLEKLGLTPHCAPLNVLKLSNIQHLWTPIYSRLPTNIHPLDIVEKLHPTPAVAGVPPQVVCEQIQCYENFDRSLYAAPLGWVDCEGNGEFIVGIRSALIAGNRARLYAGAGIVSGSDPDRELAEIQLKFQTLLKALQ